MSASMVINCVGTGPQMKGPLVRAPVCKASPMAAGRAGLLRSSFLQRAQVLGSRIVARPLFVSSSVGSGDIVGPISKSKLRKMKKAEVEQLLDQRSLDTNGTKEALVERFLTAQGEDAAVASDDEFATAGPEIVSVSRQARGAVLGERKSAPLVEAPPADLEDLQKDLDRLDVASADLVQRVEAANQARENERRLLEEVTSEIEAAKQKLALEQAAQEAAENAEELRASVQVHEKAISMLQGVIDRHPEAVAPVPAPAAKSVAPTPTSKPITGFVVFARTIRNLFASGRPAAALLEKPTAPATVLVTISSLVTDVLAIFKRHTKKDKRFLVDLAAVIAAALVVLKLGS